YGKEHRRREAYARAPERAEPVEGLDGGWHADAQGQNGEGHARPRTHAADEHVVAPDEEAQKADCEHGEDHREVAEDGLAREGGEYVRGRAHARKYGDVDFRVSEEPEEVLPQNRRAARVVNQSRAVTEVARHEETGARVLVEEQEYPCGEQHWKREERQDGCREPSPAGERHTHELHALRSK